MGRHLLQQLAQQGVDLRQVVLLLRQPQLWLQQAWMQPFAAVRLVHGELADVHRWQGDGWPCKLQGIYHLAAVVRHSRPPSPALQQTNVAGTAAMVRLAAEHQCRLVYVSTSGTVGCSRDPQAQPDEAAPYCQATVARWPYYSSKIAAEAQARRLASALHADMVVLRPPMLLGPGDHPLRASSQISRFLRGRLPFLLRGGIHYIDIRDAAAALVAAMAHPRPRPIYHLRGTACSLRTFFNDVARLSGRRAPRLMLPAALLWPLAWLDVRLGQLWRGSPLGLLPDPVVLEMAQHYWDVGSRYAEADLGYLSRPPAQTLAATLAWLQAHHPALQARRG